MNVQEAANLTSEELNELPISTQRSLIKESYDILAENDVDILVEVATTVSMSIIEAKARRIASIPKFEYADAVMDPTDDESYDSDALRDVNETMAALVNNPEALQRVFRRVFVHAREQCREMKRHIIAAEAHAKALEEIIRG